MHIQATNSAFDLDILKSSETWMLSSSGSDELSSSPRLFSLSLLFAYFPARSNGAKLSIQHAIRIKSL